MFGNSHTCRFAINLIFYLDINTEQLIGGSSGFFLSRGGPEDNIYFPLDKGSSSVILGSKLHQSDDSVGLTIATAFIDVIIKHDLRLLFIIWLTIVLLKDSLNLYTLLWIFALKLLSLATLQYSCATLFSNTALQHSFATLFSNTPLQHSSEQHTFAALLCNH